MTKLINADVIVIIIMYAFLFSFQLIHRGEV